MKLNCFDVNSAVIEDMKKDTSYVYIYGAGDLGKNVFDFLQSLGIKIDAYVLDDEYFVSNIDDTPCISTSNAMSTALKSEVYLVWAIASPLKLKKEMEDNRFKEAWITYECNKMWKDRNFAIKNREKFEAAKKLFTDEKSKRTFEAYLKNYNENQIDDDLQVIEEGTYFNELTSENRQGAFVDCGGYVGDTVLKYVNIYGADHKIYSFEPDIKNYIKLLLNTKNLNIVPINAGCWSSKTTLRFNSGALGGSAIDDTGFIEVPVDSIDNVVKDDKVAFIKMDVEGSELEALRGAEKTIRRDMPTLAISAYHKQEDLIDLPNYINGLKNNDFEYKLYLRHHGCDATELVIYAIPQRI